MNSAVKRILSALTLLAIFSLALYLRFYGMDWSYKDGGSSEHPDEWFYRDCATNDLNPQGLTEEELQLPVKEQAQLLYERNLTVDESKEGRGSPGLRIRNYNYGTFPLHVYALYSTYLQKHFNAETGWNFLAFPDWLSGILLAFMLIVGLRMYIRLSRDLREIDGRNVPWYKDEQRLMFFFPCLFIPFTGLVLAAVLPGFTVDLSKYNQGSLPILLVGRAVTAYAGGLTVLLAYLIGRDAYNRTTGLIAAAMLATAMLHVQTSHFATTDVILGFLTTAAVYCFLKISQKPRLYWYIIGAICTGFAVGTKWSGITLPGILLLAHAMATLGDKRQGKVGRWIHSVWLLYTAAFLAHFFMAAKSNTPPIDVTFAAFRDFYWSYKWFFGVGEIILFLGSLYLLILRKRWHGGQVGWFMPAVRIYRPWVWLSIAIVVGLVAFMIAEPMAYFDAKEFGKSIAEQSKLNATGENPIVFTQQYRNTLPVIYSLDNLFYPSLDWVTAFFVIGGCIFAFAQLFRDGSHPDLLLCAWVIPSFILYSSMHSKFPRYMDAILPVMMVLGARWITALISIRPKFYSPYMPGVSERWKKAFKAFGMVGGAAALICGLIYAVSYVGIYNRPHTLVEAGQWMRGHMKRGALITQNSWDNGIGIHIESKDQIGIHTSADQELRSPAERIRYLARMLNKFDYVVFPSKRGYGTTLHNPDKFPVTNKFLRAFFAEQLGFKVAKVFTNPPRFLGYEFRVDNEDETARVYDHPKVIIFEKTQKFTPEQLRDLIQNPPDWVNRITDQEILNIRDGHPVFSTPPDYPLLQWLIFLFVLGWIAFFLLFPIAAYLPDRGYGISKIVGIALFAWISWFSASTGLMNLSYMQGIFILTGLAVLAAIIARRHKDDIVKFLKQKWLLLIGLELVFLLVLAIFMGTRAYHPAAIGGEKHMNMAFINAVYRAETFPPEDPWASGHSINYYYYGHATISIIGRFAGLPPEYLFNIGGATVSALAALAIFTLAYTLTRRTFIALLAMYLGCFAGHAISYINFVKYDLIRNGKAELAANIGFRECINGFSVLCDRMWNALLYYIGRGTPEIEASFRELHYDEIFWKSSRIIPHTVANEFPAWTHLFQDMHAHQLVIPFTFAFLVLLYNYFAQPRETHRVGNTFGLTFFLGLLLGTVICTNTWDLPALGIALLLITAVKFYREYDMFGQPMVRSEWISPKCWHNYLRFPITHIVMIFGFSVLLFIPFHTNFVSRVSSVGVMTEGNTLLPTYLGYLGHLLIPVVIAAILLAVLGKEGRITMRRTVIRAALFASFFMLSVALAIMITRNNLFGFPPAVDANLPLNYSIIGLFLPFLMVLFLMMWRRKYSPEFVFTCLIGVLGLGLSLGIEIFYINEGMAPPSHRWNTAFKFNLQVWHYLSIAAAISFLWIPEQLMRLNKQARNWLSSVFSPKVLTSVVIILLLTPIMFITLPFAILGPVLVTQASGGMHDARKPTPTLDAYAYLRHENYADYSAVQWCNRFLPDSTRIVETAYRHGGNHARFSSYTGLPTIVGWPHHTRERLNHVAHIVNRRVHDMERIYTTKNPKEALNLLGKYQVEYLVFGEIERHTRRGDQNERMPLGAEGLKNLENMGGVLQLEYRNKDTSIFKVNRSLNRIYGIEDEIKISHKPALPPALQPPEKGASLFQGGKGDDNGQFNEPRGIVSDASGTIYVADTFNNRFQAFHPNGAYAWKTGEKGSNNGQFKEPNDLTIDPKNGRIYIIDTWNSRVVVYDSNGIFLGASPSSFYGPRGIVFHPKWRLLYITDTGGGRIVVITPDGKILQTWGKKGTVEEFGDEALLEPVGIDITSNGNVIVVDSLNKRVRIFTPEGILVGGWPIQTTWKGEGGFESHVACSADGTVYLTDPKEASVHVYSLDGELNSKIRNSIDKKPLRLPIGITITPQGQVLVSDMMRSQIVRVK